MTNRLWVTLHLFSCKAVIMSHHTDSGWVTVYLFSYKAVSPVLGMQWPTGSKWCTHLFSCKAVLLCLNPWLTACEWHCVYSLSRLSHAMANRKWVTLQFKFSCKAVSLYLIPWSTGSEQWCCIWGCLISYVPCHDKQEVSDTAFIFLQGCFIMSHPITISMSVTLHLFSYKAVMSHPMINSLWVPDTTCILLESCLIMSHPMTNRK